MLSEDLCILTLQADDYQSDIPLEHLRYGDLLIKYLGSTDDLLHAVEFTEVLSYTIARDGTDYKEVAYTLMGISPGSISQTSGPSIRGMRISGRVFFSLRDSGREVRFDRWEAWSTASQARFRTIRINGAYGIMGTNPPTWVNRAINTQNLPGSHRSGTGWTHWQTNFGDHSIAGVSPIVLYEDTITGARFTLEIAVHVPNW